MEKLVRKLGVVKQKDFDKDFDRHLKIFKSMAIQMGYIGELKFKKEKGKVIIFVELDE